MSNITFFPLGGMDENDKPCYVLEVDQEYYLINFGIAIPVVKTLGIQKIMPYVDWVNKYQKKIKAILIGNASFTNIGAIQYCYEYIKNIPIFTSKLGAVILNTHFNKKSMQNASNFNELNINEVDPLKSFVIGKIKVTPFRVTTYLPDAYGFIITTANENIIYIDDFIVDNTNNLGYKNDLNKLPLLTYKQNNLILICNVGNVDNHYGFTSPNHETENYYMNLLLKGNNKRLIVACYYHDIYTFNTLANIAKQKQLPFIIYNPIFMNILSAMITNKYFDNTKLPLLPISKINEIEKGIVVVSSTPDRLFNKLLSITKNEDDILALKKSDTVVLGFKVNAGFEKMYAEILDAYANLEINVVFPPKTILSATASSEDINYLVNLIRPKYVIPTLGYYYQNIAFANTLKKIGYSNDNIIIMENGDIANFSEGVYSQGKKRNDVSSVYVGSQGIMSEGFNIFQERQVMSENGIIFCTIRNNAKTNSVNHDDILINQYATIDLSDNSIDFLTTLKDDLCVYINNLIKENKTLTHKDNKNLIKKFVSKQFDKNYQKDPIVVVSII